MSHRSAGRQWRAYDSLETLKEIVGTGIEKEE
jgi:hypothetical protein